MSSSVNFNCSCVEPGVVGPSGAVGAVSNGTASAAYLAALAEQESRHALIYIIVVLSFYSAGIVVMMVKYMRHEREEHEQESLYKQYVHAARHSVVDTTSRGRLANRLALQALNMANAVPQTARPGSKVTFV